VGVTLTAEGMEFHIPKAYIYFAMGFPVLLNHEHTLRDQKTEKATGCGYLIVIFNLTCQMECCDNLFTFLNFIENLNCPGSPFDVNFDTCDSR